MADEYVEIVRKINVTEMASKVCNHMIEARDDCDPYFELLNVISESMFGKTLPEVQEDDIEGECNAVYARADFLVFNLLTSIPDARRGEKQ